MASARRVGLNVTVSTFDDTGSPDYTDFDAWEADTDIDLVSAGVSHRLELQQNKLYTKDNSNFSGDTSDADHFRSVGPAEGVKHDGTPNSGAGFTTPNDIPFFVSDDYVQIHDLVIKMSTNTSADAYVIWLAGDESAAIGCVIDTPSNAGAGEATAIRGRAIGSSSYAIDCLVIDAKTDGVQWGGGSLYAYNCTVIGSGRDNFASSADCVNCLAQGAGGQDFNAATTTTCISQDATGDIQATLTFVDAGNDDYHLAASDTAAIGAGTDLSADANYAFDDDIDGDTITAWSIGADAQVAAAGISPGHDYQHRRSTHAHISYT